MFHIANRTNTNSKLYSDNNEAGMHTNKIYTVKVRVRNTSRTLILNTMLIITTYIPGSMVNRER